MKYILLFCTSTCNERGQCGRSNTARDYTARAHTQLPCFQELEIPFPVPNAFSRYRFRAIVHPLSRHDSTHPPKIPSIVLYNLLKALSHSPPTDSEHCTVQSFPGPIPLTRHRFRTLYLPGAGRRRVFQSAAMVLALVPRFTRATTSRFLEHGACPDLQRRAKERSEFLCKRADLQRGAKDRSEMSRGSPGPPPAGSWTGAPPRSAHHRKGQLWNLGQKDRSRI